MTYPVRCSASCLVDLLLRWLEAAWKEVSVFDSAERAAAKARARDLGEFLAVLEVPDETPMSHGNQGHKGLIGTTPEELLAYVQAVHPVGEF